MKIPCTVHGKAALVVGYAPGKKGRPMAVVITEGALQAVRLKHIELGELPKALRAASDNVVPLRETSEQAEAS